MLIISRSLFGVGEQENKKALAKSEMSFGVRLEEVGRGFFSMESLSGGGNPHAGLDAEGTGNRARQGY